MAEAIEKINGDTKPAAELSKAREANWPAVLFFIHIHLLSLYGLWLLFFEVHWMTVVLFLGLTSLGVLGVTAGAHRLWAHHTYKASKSLKVFLMLCQTLTGQGSIYDWVQTHKLHHAHFATDNDPYNCQKGLMYAHVLSRLRKLSPYQEHLKNSIDMTDLENDNVVMIQKRLYWLLYGIFFILLPLNAPLEYWNDSVLSSVFVIGFLRYGVVLHASWLVESSILVWGLQKDEKNPSDSNIVFLLTKSFWPQYHYIMPCDYKSGEYGTYDSGCTTAFIRVWAALGLATSLRTVEPASVQKALADAAKKKSSVADCLLDATKSQTLPQEHYMRRE